ncbi:MAG: hypothetical protein M3Y22_05860 [Pseudomonadota bacterium]|nr:hypothetical protein [Pseudomonadota bacterium]
MTTSSDLLDLVYQAVRDGNTDAGPRIFKPGDWPTQPDQYPIIKMRLVTEDRQSISRSGPAEFITTATIRLATEVSALATPFDAGATAAESQLWALKRQVDVAVVNSYPLMSEIQQIAAMRSQLTFTSEAATHLAGMQTDIALEFYEGPEGFAAVQTDDLTEIDVVLPNHPPTGATFHLNQ